MADRPDMTDEEKHAEALELFGDAMVEDTGTVIWPIRTKEQLALVKKQLGLEEQGD
jgi:hypothetical protein